MPFIFLILDKARNVYAQGNVSLRSEISVQLSITLRPPTAELYSQQVRCLVISNLAINFFTSQLAHTNLLVRKSDSGLANQTQKAPGRPVIEDRISAGCHNTVWRKTYWTHRTSSGATLTPLPYLFQQTQG
jgi:hypothetical protein